MDIQITWRNLDRSPSVDAEIRRHFDKLSQFCDQIVSARISIEMQKMSHSTQHTFHAALEVQVPDAEIVVSHDPHDNQAKYDLHRVIHHAFDAARRQLQDYVRIRRGQVKRHAG